MSCVCYVYPLLKPKHTVRELFIRLLRHIRIIWISVMAVEKFHDVKAAAIHIEVDIPLLKIPLNIFLLAADESIVSITDAKSIC